MITVFPRVPSPTSKCACSKVVRILHAEGVEFASVNVLEDAELREGIKQYSEWPTIPQVRVRPFLRAHRRLRRTSPTPFLIS